MLINTLSVLDEQEEKEIVECGRTTPISPHYGTLRPLLQSIQYWVYKVYTIGYNLYMQYLLERTKNAITFIEFEPQPLLPNSNQLSVLVHHFVIEESRIILY